VLYKLHSSRFFTGFLQSDDGFILKPVQASEEGVKDSGKGERELQFYLSVFSADCHDPVVLQLRQFLPLFYGTWTTPEYPGRMFNIYIDIFDFSMDSIIRK